MSAVLDIRMAGMSGIEVLERLKFVDPDIEVVMMTAFETTDTMRQALRLRACDYINKPFDVSTMRAAVANAMQRRTLESEIHNNAEKLQELLNELQNQKIEEQMAHTRGEIYASIIHDINGPLTVISGFVQLMNQRIGARHAAGSRRPRVHQGPAQDHHPPGHQLHRDFPPLPGLPAPPADEAPRVGVNQLLTDLDHLVRVHPSLARTIFHGPPAGRGHRRADEWHRCHPGPAEPGRQCLPVHAASPTRSRSRHGCCPSRWT